MDVKVPAIDGCSAGIPCFDLMTGGRSSAMVPTTYGVFGAHAKREVCGFSSTFVSLPSAFARGFVSGAGKAEVEPSPQRPSTCTLNLFGTHQRVS